MARAMRRGVLCGLLIVGALLPALLPPGRAQAAEAGFVVIVHPTTEAAAVDRTLLSRLFLRKTTIWPDGRAARPVDLPLEDATREAFTREVHRRTVAAVRNFWNQQIFTGGTTAPPEKSAPQAVIDFVKATPGAVGYVPAKSNLEGVKVVTVGE